MPQLDTRDLRGESLATRKFPAEIRADFRLFIAPEVRRGIEQHAQADVTVEICGILVGNWFTDENGPYALVTNYIRCNNATSKFAEVTFTHESWAHINKEMDSKFKDDRIVGWYHTHPDFGIFLSDRDCFIHEHFFSSPGQVAYVIDPVRRLEGVFAWNAGKPVALPHYWIGDSICTVEASRSGQRKETAEQAAAAMNAADNLDRSSSSALPSGIVPTLLGLLLTFLLGYYYAGWRSRWEQQMIVEGTVAHFANTKLIREGFEDDVTAVRSRLTTVLQAIDQFPKPGDQLSDEQIAAYKKLQSDARDHLTLSATALDRIREVYGLTEANRAELALIASQKQAELRRLQEALAKTKPTESVATKTENKGASSKPAKSPADKKAAASSPVATPKETSASAKPLNSSAKPEPKAPVNNSTK